MFSEQLDIAGFCDPNSLCLGASARGPKLMGSALKMTSRCRRYLYVVASGLLWQSGPSHACSLLSGCVEVVTFVIPRICQL